MKMYQSILILSLSLALASSECFADGDAPKDLDPSLCDYDHLLEQKLISESDPEKKGDFRKRFDECIPIHEEWAIEAVKRLDPDQKDMIIDYHELHRQYDESEKILAIFLSERIDLKTLKEIARDRLRFYREIFKVQLDKMCTGLDGTLKDLSRIYELITGVETDDENVEGKVKLVKILHETAKHVTFEWIIYADSCQLLNEQQKFLSEEVRSLFLDRKGNKNWLSNLLKCFGKDDEKDYDDPDDFDFETLSL